MQQPMPQPVPPAAVKKPGRFKLILGMATLLGCVCSGIGFAAGFALRDSIKTTPSVTPTATPSVTVTVSTTPSVSGAPTVTTDPDAYNGWITYVLSDCNVRLKAPPDWFPGKRGELGTCGSFRSTGDAGFTTFDEFEGALILFIPFLENRTSTSPFAFNAENVTDYLERVITDPQDLNPDDDLLIGDVAETTLAGKPVKRATIKRATAGTASHTFYTLFGSEFVIMSGGKMLEAEQSQINLMLNSIEFIEPISGQ